MMIVPIGGADMPTVISLLNSYAGLSAAAMGFVLDSKLLIIAGALDGSSGFILSVIMSKAMNRSFSNVLFGAFGQVQTSAAAAQEARTVRSATAEEAATILAAANAVVIVPGYGMAVAQAQHKVRELFDALTKRGVDVKFGIHAVAGRMPGHMNVLLAEADIPYDRLLDMDAVNPEFPQTDVALVIGANDVTNPAAKTDQASPIYGMPILEVDKARTVMVIKRSLNPGFAGIDNPLYYLIRRLCSSATPGRSWETSSANLRAAGTDPCPRPRDKGDGLGSSPGVKRCCWRSSCSPTLPPVRTPQQRPKSKTEETWSAPSSAWKRSWVSGGPRTSRKNRKKSRPPIAVTTPANSSCLTLTKGCNCGRGLKPAVPLMPRNTMSSSIPWTPTPAVRTPVTASLAHESVERFLVVVPHEDFHANKELRKLPATLGEAASTLIGFLTASEVARQEFGEPSEVYRNLLREPELFSRKAEIVNRYHARLSQLYAAARAGEISEHDALAQKQQVFEEIQQACKAISPAPKSFNPCPAANNNAGLAFDATYTKYYPLMYSLYRVEGRALKPTLDALQRALNAQTESEALRNLQDLIKSSPATATELLATPPARGPEDSLSCCSPSRPPQ